MFPLLLARQKNKSFLYKTVTGDARWVFYDTPKHKPE